MINIFQIIGALGLILISIAVLIKKKKYEDILFILGGLCLEAYSISIKNIIFIILQAVFILASGYELIKTYVKK